MADPLEKQKLKAAECALEYLRPKLGPDSILGIGTGSTTNQFIDLLAGEKAICKGAVASSEASAQRLVARGMEVYDLNSTGPLSFYIDGADEVDPEGRMVKGGGGAHTREKILATVSECFLCLIDSSKSVRQLGRAPLPVEVIAAARSHVARKLVALGGEPHYRSGLVTDNGNVILDVHGLPMDQPEELEAAINRITGVVENGLFAARKADFICLGHAEGSEISRPGRGWSAPVAGSKRSHSWLSRWRAWSPGSQGAGQLAGD